jgi:hypothetical protein
MGVWSGSEVPESFLDAFSNAVIGPDKIITGIEPGIECVGEVSTPVSPLTPITIG